jgi:biotin synthase
MSISSQALAGTTAAKSKLDAGTWTVEAIAQLYELPFSDLLYRAQGIHREHFAAGEIELATLLSIKTGGCPEDCAYCPQAARYHTGVEKVSIPLEGKASLGDITSY